MWIAVGAPLPSALRDVTVFDAAGAPRRLGELLHGATLLVFLRHFGCIHCSRQVDLLTRRLPELADLGVGAVLVGSGPPVELASFCERQALSTRPLVVVTDPSLAAYRAAGLERSRARLVSPRAIVDELRTMARGYLPRRPAGDVAQLGGALLVDERGAVAFHHASARPADLADVSDIVDAALRLTAGRVASWRI